MSSSRKRDEDQQTGAVWALIQQWMDAHPYAPSQAKLAERIQVSASRLSDWKYRQGWPEREPMERLAKEIGVPYDWVLEAFLVDHGYRPQSPVRRNA